ncbi:MAG: hypothetical protein LUC41_02345 [Clostridiales bacterium]|nr:hypothetical protein [Clostridiales bacterium]
MLAAVKGVLHGNTVVIDNEDIKEYDGSDVIVTLLNYKSKRNRPLSVREDIDWDSYVLPSERGVQVEEYMKEMRDEDRL